MYRWRNPDEKDGTIVCKNHPNPTFLLHWSTLKEIVGYRLRMPKHGRLHIECCEVYVSRDAITNRLEYTNSSQIVRERNVWPRMPPCVTQVVWRIFKMKRLRFIFHPSTYISICRFFFYPSPRTRELKSFSKNLWSALKRWQCKRGVWFKYCIAPSYAGSKRITNRRQ